MLGKEIIMNNKKYIYSIVIILVLTIAVFVTTMVFLVNANSNKHSTTKAVSEEDNALKDRVKESVEKVAKEEQEETSNNIQKTSSDSDLDESNSIKEQETIDKSQDIANDSNSGTEDINEESEQKVEEPVGEPEPINKDSLGNDEEGAPYEEAVYRREDIPDDKLSGYTYGKDVLTVGEANLSPRHIWKLKDCMDMMDYEFDASSVDEYVGKISIVDRDHEPGLSDYMLMLGCALALCEYKGWSYDGPEIAEMKFEFSDHFQRSVDAHAYDLKTPDNKFYRMYCLDDKIYIEDATNKMFKLWEPN